MSFPLSSGRQPVAASAAPDAPTTLRKSRRLTAGTFVSLLISVVAVGAVVARLLALDRRDRGRRRRGVRADAGLRRIPGGLEPFLRAVAVDVAADAPAHVEARELVDALHVLDLAVTSLARN